MAALVMLGCGSGCAAKGSSESGSGSATNHVPGAIAHPHAVDPVAGQEAGRAGSSGASGYSAPGGVAHDVPPVAPATDTRGPAKGAPTDSEVRAEVARFQLAIARYHLDRLNLSNALLNLSALPPGQYNVSVASVFTDYGLPIACGGVLHVPQLGVANKTLPCGTEVIFRYGGRAIRVPVIDRGPYIAGREWDLTGAAAEALHFPGLGEIEWRLG